MLCSFFIDSYKIRTKKGAKMTQKFYLSRHKNGIWYARFVDQETGKLITSRSTKEYNRKAAEAKCYEWINSGEITSSQNKKNKLKLTTKTIVTQITQMNATQSDAREVINVLKAKGLIESVIYKHSPASEKAADFLKRFWDWNTSPYIQEKKLYKHTIHKYYTHRNEGYILNYWVPFLEDKSLGSVTKQDIKAFQQYLNKFDLSSESMNQITRCGVTAFKWAYNNELTEHNCFDGLTFCALTHKKREVLTLEQAALIFSMEWDSPYSKLANLTAMMTGMRAGEIQALRMEDIVPDDVPELLSSFLRKLGVAVAGKVHQIPAAVDQEVVYYLGLSGGGRSHCEALAACEHIDQGGLADVGAANESKLRQSLLGFLDSSCAASRKAGVGDLHGALFKTRANITIFRQ